MFSRRGYGHEETILVKACLRMAATARGSWHLLLSLVGLVVLALLAQSVVAAHLDAVRGREAFDADELIQTWVVHHVQLIGEACRGVSQDFRGEHPDIPWSEIIGMRNILVHRYFGIDRQAVWAVVERDLPDLRRKLDAVLRRG